MASKLLGDVDTRAETGDQMGLTCPICLEVYNEPKSLVCLHTFCKSCIHAFVMKMKDNGTLNLKTGIQCPLCRKLTTVGQGQMPPENWTETLPANYAIVAVMEAVSVTKQEVEPQIIMCGPCQKRNKSEKATLYCGTCGEYQCNKCTKVHDIYTYMKGHNMCQLENITESLSQTNASVIMARFEQCETHCKRIKYICKDEMKLCCSACAITKHRGCQNVVEINEIADVKENNRTESVKTKLIELRDHLGTTLKKFELNEKETDSQIDYITGQVKGIRVDVNKAIDDFEQKVLAETFAIKKQASTKVDEGRALCQKLQAALESSLCTHKAVLEHGSASQLFIVMHKLEEQLIGYEQSSGETSSKLESVEISLKIENNIKTFVDPSTKIGVVSVIYTNESGMTTAMGGSPAGCDSPKENPQLSSPVPMPAVAGPTQAGSAMSSALPTPQQAAAKGTVTHAKEHGQADDIAELLEGGEPDFPVQELGRLDKMLNVQRGYVLILPNCELQILLDAFIKLCKAGQDIRSEACQHFFNEGLTSAFTKIMKNKAVQVWTDDVQKGILMNAEKLVELCVTKLSQDCLPLLKLLALVFNPRCNFHACNKERQSKTVQYDEGLSAKSLKCETPYGWLVDLINRFGSLDGFQILLDRFITGPPLSVTVIAALVEPFGQCAELLTPHTKQNYMWPIVEVVKKFMAGLTYDERSQPSTKGSVLSITRAVKKLVQTNKTGTLK